MTVHMVSGHPRAGPNLGQGWVLCSGKLSPKVIHNVHTSLDAPAVPSFPRPSVSVPSKCAQAGLWHVFKPRAC
jgi:hypothetical protein